MAKLLLLKYGADPNPRDHKEDTPLLLACAQSTNPVHHEIMRLLIDFNANVKAKNLQCLTTLHYVCFNNDIPNAMYLVDCGVDVNAEDHKFGKTALHYCAENGFHELCSKLIVRGADIYASGDKVTAFADDL